MPTLRSTAALLSATLVAAACGDARSFDGTFTATRDGVTSRARIVQDGDVLRGDVHASGVSISLEGTVDGRRASGRLLAGGIATPFHAVATDTGFDMTLVSSEPLSGRAVEARFRFLRDGPSAAHRWSDAAPRGPAGATPLDAGLVGRWSRSQSFGGDREITAAMEEFLELGADGSLRSGLGRFVGGGAGIATTHAGGEVQSGRWRAVDGVLEVAGAGDWVPFARYHAEGESLLLTFGDGSRQVWRRGR